MKRLYSIDLIKGFAALLVIFIHTLARYRFDDELVFYIWDYAHFAVGLFVFASGYMMAFNIKRRTDYFTKGSDLLARFWRIYKPYLFYVIIHLGLFLAFGAYFDGLSSSWRDPAYIFDTLLLDGGVGNNWIPRLFILFALIQFAVDWIARASGWSKFYMVAFVFSFVLSIYFLIEPDHENESMILFTSWYSIFEFGRVYFNYREHVIMKYIVPSLAALGFIVLSLWMDTNGVDAGLFNNKYPPSTLFVLYQIMLAGVTMPIFSYLGRLVGDTELGWVRGFVKFLSANSYNIFFAHIIVMDLVEYTGNMLIEFGLIVMLTLGAMVIVNRFDALMRSTLGKKIGLFNH